MFPGLKIETEIFLCNFPRDGLFFMFFFTPEFCCLWYYIWYYILWFCTTTHTHQLWMRTQVYSNYTCYFSITGKKKNPLLSFTFFYFCTTSRCFALLKASDRNGEKNRTREREFVRLRFYRALLSKALPAKRLLWRWSCVSVYKCATMLKCTSSCMVLFLYLLKTTCEQLLLHWWKKKPYFLCSQTCIKSHYANLKTTLHAVSLRVSLNIVDRWSALARTLSTPPRCCIKAHSSWCWQCAEG